MCSSEGLMLTARGVLGAAGVGGEAGQRVEGQVHLAGAAAELEATHLRLEVGRQHARLQELEEGPPDVRRGDHHARRDLLAALEDDARGAITGRREPDPADAGPSADLRPCARAALAIAALIAPVPPCAGPRRGRHRDLAHVVME